MPLLYYVQTAMTGLAIIGILFFHAGRRGPYAVASQRVFELLLLFNSALLLLEMLLNLFTGVGTALARGLLPPIVCLFYILNPVPEALWVFYLSVMMNGEQWRPSGRKAFLILLPVILNAALSLASMTTGWLFTVDAENRYARGPYFALMALSCYSYVVFYIALALRKRRFLHKREYLTLLCAALPPILAGILQSLFYGISILWLVLAFSLLIFYMNIQSTQVYTDHLTGLANRRKFDALLWQLPDKRRPMGGMLIDVDGFKQINDVHGHLTGDQVLETVGTLLRRSLRRNDLVARIGGDEFAVLMEVEDREHLARAVERIEKSVEEFNRSRRYPFELGLSIGYQLWEPGAGQTQAQFFQDLDQRMYERKRAASPKPEDAVPRSGAC